MGKYLKKTANNKRLSASKVKTQADKFQLHIYTAAEVENTRIKAYPILA